MYYTMQKNHDDLTFTLERSKPRAKQLNEVLMSRKGGRMSTKDEGRNKNKQELRRTLKSFSSGDFRD